MHLLYDTASCKFRVTYQFFPKFLFCLLFQQAFALSYFPPVHTLKQYDFITKSLSYLGCPQTFSPPARVLRL